MLTDQLTRAKSLIRVIQDHPEPGIAFQDITPLLADGPALRACVEALIEPFEGTYDVVAGLEARGFLLAGAAAMIADCGLVPLRKQGKLPRPVASARYDLEYGQATLEASEDVVPDMRVLLLDDVLATGGTLRAGAALIAECGAEVIGSAALLELPGLGGRAAVGEIHTLFTA